VRRFALALTGAVSLAFALATPVLAAPEDRGGASLAVPPAIIIARQSQEVQALQAELVSVSGERDQLQQQRDALRQQMADLQGQVADLQRQLAALTSGIGGGGGGVRPSGSGPNHFSFGYCTWYVATRRYVPWFGDAGQWGPNAAAMGFPEGRLPHAGAIMVTWEGPIGHVAYVEAVNADGSWVVSEMNYVAWDVVDRRLVRPGTVPLETFIY
jgi:surface antigen